jgi:23S rRNA (uracil1939-C5)-methyltransferase
MGRKKRSYTFENIEVTDAGSRGKSIARTPEGQVILLNNAIPGDVVDIRTGRKRKSYFEGTAIKFHKYSDRRTAPVCAHFEFCGGCKWQHMAYSHQLYFKDKEVANNLIRIGKVTVEEKLPIVGAEQIYFYRNKMEFSFSDSRWLTPEEIKSETPIENRHACGFHIAGMWDKILNIEECHLQADPSNAIRNFIRDFSMANTISFFNPRSQNGQLRTVMIRMSSTGEIMIVIQFYHEDRYSRILLMDALANEFPEITSLLYVVNSKGNDTIYDQDVVLYKGNDHIFESMEGLRFKIGPKSFYQTNSEQAYRLYDIARSMANLSGSEIVYDLYTGTGTIAQFVAKKCKKVIGIESVPEAIEDARYNAQLNGIKNVEFLIGDMKEVFTDSFVSKHGQPDVIITDPPRDGMHRKVVDKIMEIKPNKIVYISCNSATQARDLEVLKKSYTIATSQAVDMFPQTAHVENIVLLTLKS